MLKFYHKISFLEANKNAHKHKTTAISIGVQRKHLYEWPAKQKTNISSMNELLELLISKHLKLLSFKRVFISPSI